MAALRLYTTHPAYRYFNDPLRDAERRQQGERHPLPLCLSFLHEGLHRLSRVDASTAESTLWRGVRGVKVDDAFMTYGGTDCAPMSTTSDVRVAIRYSLADNALLLRVRCINGLMRGKDVAFLSAFPDEAECLYPPLTFLQPTGRTEEIHVPGISATEMDSSTQPVSSRITVVEVTPTYAMA